MILLWSYDSSLSKSCVNFSQGFSKSFGLHWSSWVYQSQFLSHFSLCSALVWYFYNFLAILQSFQTFIFFIFINFGFRTKNLINPPSSQPQHLYVLWDGSYFSQNCVSPKICFIWHWRHPGPGFRARSSFLFLSMFRRSTRNRSRSLCQDVNPLNFEHFQKISIPPSAHFPSAPSPSSPPPFVSGGRLPSPHFSSPWCRASGRRPSL